MNTWNQIYNPLGNAGLSTLAAAVPVVTLLVLIASGKGGGECDHRELEQPRLRPWLQGSFTSLLCFRLYYRGQQMLPRLPGVTILTIALPLHQPLLCAVLAAILHHILHLPIVICCGHFCTDFMQGVPLTGHHPRRHTTHEPSTARLGDEMPDATRCALALRLRRPDFVFDFFRRIVILT